MKKTNRRKFIQATTVSAAALIAGGKALAKVQMEKTPIVRIARLKIDPNQLDNYKMFLKEVGETSVKAEPGVLTLYSASEKDSPSNITVFEIYADEAAYRSHIETPHFKKYKSSTKEMVKSLELMEMTPIVLASKK
jgi:quinol monooxygenase YgiN